MFATTCCRGTYHRGPDAVWRYAWGDPVPGARDLSARAALRRLGFPGWESVALTPPLVQRALDLQQAPGVLAVVGDDAGDLVVGLEAPELEPAALLTVADLAQAADLPRAAVDSQVVRGALPTHQLVLDGGRRWARPVVERWLATPRSTDDRVTPGVVGAADLG